MRLRPALIMLLVSLAVPSVASAQFYVFGDYCTACLAASATNQMFDDGLHGDGAAGDGVYGASIVVDKPAGAYRWRVGTNPSVPQGLPNCGFCASPGVPAQLWTTGPGDVIHFRRGGPPAGPGWVSPGVSCDHGMPAGTQLSAVILDASFMVQVPVCSAQKSGSIWSCTASIPAAGSNYMAFTAPGLLFGTAYNAACGCPVGEGFTIMVPFVTGAPNADVLFEFDELTGSLRASVPGTTPTLRTPWGRLKTIYR